MPYPFRKFQCSREFGIYACSEAYRYPKIVAYVLDAYLMGGEI